MGLFRRTISLDSIIHYEKREIDTNHNKNPFNIVRLVSKNKKYLVFRQIIITTENGTKIKLDERTIYTEDFKILYNKIRGSRKGRTN